MPTATSIDPATVAMVSARALLYAAVPALLYQGNGRIDADILNRAASDALTRAGMQVTDANMARLLG